MMGAHAGTLERDGIFYTLVDWRDVACASGTVQRLVGYQRPRRPEGSTTSARVTAGPGRTQANHILAVAKFPVLARARPSNCGAQIYLSGAPPVITLSTRISAQSGGSGPPRSCFD